MSAIVMGNWADGGKTKGRLSRRAAENSMRRYNQMVSDEAAWLRSTRPKFDLVRYYQYMNLMSSVCPYKKPSHDYFMWVTEKMEEWKTNTPQRWTELSA